MLPKKLLRALGLQRPPPPETTEEYTPRTFITGYIHVPPTEKRYRDAIWHAAAVALDTDAVRLICERTGDGVYYLAAPAADFANHPLAVSVLAAALPNTPGHQGDGAYCCELGSGIVAAIKKGNESLESYIGEHRDIERFVGPLTVFWPQQASAWAGHREMQSRSTQKTLNFFSLVGAILVIFLFAAGVLARSAAANLGNGAELARQNILQAQVKVATELQEIAPNPFLEYHRISADVLARDGILQYFDATAGKLDYAAELPAWVSDFGALTGATREVQPGGQTILITRGVKRN